MAETQASDGAVRHSADVPTAYATRYMIQLCKHFQHTLPAEHEGDHGRIEFPSLGICRLGARPEGLLLSVEAQGEERCARLQHVVASHLARFAFKEDLQIGWRD